MQFVALILRIQFSLVSSEYESCSLHFYRAQLLSKLVLVNIKHKLKFNYDFKKQNLKNRNYIIMASQNNYYLYDPFL